VTIYRDYERIPKAIIRRDSRNRWWVTVDGVLFGDFKNINWISIHPSFEGARKFTHTLIHLGQWPGTYPVNYGDE